MAGYDSFNMQDRNMLSVIECPFFDLQKLQLYVKQINQEKSKAIAATWISFLFFCFNNNKNVDYILNLVFGDNKTNFLNLISEIVCFQYQQPNGDFISNSFLALNLMLARNDDAIVHC